MLSAGCWTRVLGSSLRSARFLASETEARAACLDSRGVLRLGGAGVLQFLQVSGRGRTVGGAGGRSGPVTRMFCRLAAGGWGSPGAGPSLARHSHRAQLGLCRGS